MQIKTIETQKVLSPTQISLADYVINPYRGCEFGCLYCYSQENKNIKKNDFLNTIGVKINAPLVLEKELRFITPQRILLGSTTECFQYIELRYHITEQILKILNNHNIPYTVLSKSHLIAKYLKLISHNKKNKIYFTINCASDKIISRLEKKSSLLEKRLDAISKIIAAGIDIRIHIGPFIPYLTSLKEIVKILPREIKEIDIELYHHKMGNFSQILTILEDEMGQNIKEKLSDIYRTEKNYLDFATYLKNEIKDIRTIYSGDIYYIIPDFNTFYTPHLNYEKPFF